MALRRRGTHFLRTLFRFKSLINQTPDSFSPRRQVRLFAAPLVDSRDEGGISTHVETVRFHPEGIGDVVHPGKLYIDKLASPGHYDLSVGLLAALASGRDAS